jgi:hypothetical protein
MAPSIYLLVVCLKTLADVNIRVTNESTTVISEFERMWKEEIVA